MAVDLVAERPHPIHGARGASSRLLELLSEGRWDEGKRSNYHRTLFVKRVSCSKLEDEVLARTMALI